MLDVSGETVVGQLANAFFFLCDFSMPLSILQKEENTLCKDKLKITFKSKGEKQVLNNQSSTE